MLLAAHSLGCSILTMCGMNDGMFSVGAGWEPKRIDVFTRTGMAALKKHLKSLSRGGVMLWVDSSSTDTYGGNTYFNEDDKLIECSGKRFYELLKSRGEYVEKSTSYNNPGHDGKCTIYFWHFRKKGLPLASRSPANGGGSSEANGGKASKKKTKTPSRRAAA